MLQYLHTMGTYETCIQGDVEYFINILACGIAMSSSVWITVPTISNLSGGSAWALGAMELSGTPKLPAFGYETGLKSFTSSMPQFSHLEEEAPNSYTRLHR